MYPKTQNRNITIVTSVHPHHKHHTAWLEKWHIILLIHIPRPRPAFHRLHQLFAMGQLASASLQATESWARPGNEATLHQCLFIYCLVSCSIAQMKSPHSMIGKMAHNPVASSLVLSKRGNNCSLLERINSRQEAWLYKVGHK